MIKATFTIKPETKVVWAGCYGGHYDIIVFFSSKPHDLKITPENSVNEFWDTLLECKNIIGNMALGDFYELYPDADISEYMQQNKRPKEVFISQLFELEMTGPFEKDGGMKNIPTNVDGFNSI